MLVFNNRIIDKSHMDLDTDIWHLVPKYLYLALKYWYLPRRMQNCVMSNFHTDKNWSSKFYPKNAQIATDMFLRQNAENIVCVLIMKLHLSLPNLTWGKIIPGKLVVLGKVAGKKCGFLPNQGGGSSRVNKKPNLKFANVFFFQWAWRIILGGFEGGLAKDHIFSGFFRQPSLIKLYPTSEAHISLWRSLPQNSYSIWVKCTSAWIKITS